MATFTKPYFAGNTYIGRFAYPADARDHAERLGLLGSTVAPRPGPEAEPERQPAVCFVDGEALYPGDTLFMHGQNRVWSPSDLVGALNGAAAGQVEVYPGILVSVEVAP